LLDEQDLGLVFQQVAQGSGGERGREVIVVVVAGRDYASSERTYAVAFSDQVDT
jgi:hypothetical protein